MGKSLWEDEAHLALNFITKDYIGITGVLDYEQSAPVLFLLTVEAFTHIGGFSIYALRAFPLLVSLLALPLYYVLVKELIGSRITALFAFFLFAANLALIYFVNELKPYTVDVSVYIILGTIAFSTHPFLVRHRNTLLAISGSLAIVYSNVGFIVLSCIAFVYISEWYREKKVEKHMLVIMLIWACVFVVNYYFFIYRYPYAEHVRSLWAGRYLPTDLLSCEFSTFLKTTLRETGFTLLLYVSDIKGVGWLLLIVFYLGIISTVRKKNYRLLVFSCGPVLLHLGISAAEQYPFYYRFVLYLLPGLMMLMAEGSRVIANWLTQKLHIASGVIFLVIVGYLFTKPSFAQYPLWDREIKPLLDLINYRYPKATVLVTTPNTLYRYYVETGYVKNTNYKFVEHHITPEQFNQLAVQEQSNFLILHASESSIDGFGPVIENLKKKNVVVNEYENKTYKLSEVRAFEKRGIVFTSKDFNAENTFNLNGEDVVAIWGGSITSKTWKLKAGNYDLQIFSMGTPALGEQPRLRVMANGIELGKYTTQSGLFSKDHFNVSVGNNETLSLTISLENDFSDPKRNEDRNAFIRCIIASQK
jgi:hypothetical protein